MQSVTPPRSYHDDSYRCNFSGQFAKNYEIDSPSGCHHVSVVVPEVTDIEQQYAIVRRVCDDGETLPDQYIYEEQLRFTLCLTVGKMDAMMPKGINMKHSVKWEKRDGSEVIWRRVGKVFFSLVSLDTLFRQNSISRMYSATSSTLLCNSVDA